MVSIKTDSAVPQTPKGVDCMYTNFLWNDMSPMTVATRENVQLLWLFQPISVIQRRRPIDGESRSFHISLSAGSSFASLLSTSKSSSSSSSGRIVVSLRGSSSAGQSHLAAPVLCCRDLDGFVLTVRWPGHCGAAEHETAVKLNCQPRHISASLCCSMITLPLQLFQVDAGVWCQPVTSCLLATTTTDRQTDRRAKRYYCRLRSMTQSTQGTSGGTPLQSPSSLRYSNMMITVVDFRFCEGR